jgi:nitrogen fixation-related uncharacterized protein
MVTAVEGIIMIGLSAFAIGVVLYVLMWLGKHTANDDEQD